MIKIEYITNGVVVLVLQPVLMGVRTRTITTATIATCIGSNLQGKDEDLPVDLVEAGDVHHGHRQPNPHCPAHKLNFNGYPKCFENVKEGVQ